MLIAIPGLLAAEDVAHCRRVLDAGDWLDGNATAAGDAAQVKHNLQAPEAAPEAKALGELILNRLGRNPNFVSAALPAKVYPPVFNRYEVGMTYGAHIDSAIRFGDGSGGGARYRTDLSCTVFLSDAADYDGGELVIEAPHGPQPVKLNAGDLVLYPASRVHRVQPVTRGARWASVFWVQSMVRDQAQRTLLYELDQAIGAARSELGGDSRTVLGLTATYHNLMRMWAEV